MSTSRRAMPALRMCCNKQILSPVLSKVPLRMDCSVDAVQRCSLPIISSAIVDRKSKLFDSYLIRPQSRTNIQFEFPALEKFEARLRNHLHLMLTGLKTVRRCACPCEIYGIKTYFVFGILSLMLFGS